MAQWIGGDGGHTHATKVADLEASLRAAVKALHSDCPNSVRLLKAKAVLRLAGRLLAALLRLMKVRISEAPSNSEGLKAREASTREAGVDGILTELGAHL